MNYENMEKEILIKILKQKDNMLKKLYLEKEKLNYYASTDAMTGVLNRRSGLELLDKKLKLSITNNKKFVICFVDVDRLKMINDIFGHEEGDNCLISVAKIIRENIRKKDFVIRMGGDEFLVVLPETTMREANKAWSRICRRIEEINKNSCKYNLSLSYGLYEYDKRTQKEMCVSELIQKADAEMYKKKLKKKKEFDDICIININW
ncbi:GGDEF domain-containing protein [Haloimpatiens sp. FM7330]|uniref:GGDEF domain-containing protein n=1 Tax=Haloimpatiens sp. FM7330 TaxID=3298610 RepID=UPI003630C535